MGEGGSLIKFRRRSIYSETIDRKKQKQTLVRFAASSRLDSKPPFSAQTINGRFLFRVRNARRLGQYCVT